MESLTTEKLLRLIVNNNLNGSYWQATNPNRRLSLGSSPEYVRRDYPNQPPDNHFVYFTPYRVAGTVNDIINVISQTGLNLTPQEVIQNSYDPLSGPRLSRSELAQMARTPLSETYGYVDDSHTYNNYWLATNPNEKVSAYSLWDYLSQHRGFTYNEVFRVIGTPDHVDEILSQAGIPEQLIQLIRNSPRYLTERVITVSPEQYMLILPHAVRTDRDSTGIKLWLPYPDVNTYFLPSSV
jgi:hypothetical protein